jgi:hypothetical protein
MHLVLLRESPCPWRVRGSRPPSKLQGRELLRPPCFYAWAPRQRVPPIGLLPRASFSGHRYSSGRDPRQQASPPLCSFVRASPAELQGRKLLYRHTCSSTRAFTHVSWIRRKMHVYVLLEELRLTLFFFTLDVVWRRAFVLDFLVDSISTTNIFNSFSDRLEMGLESNFSWFLVCHKACLVFVLSFLYLSVILDSLHFSFIWVVI